MTSDEQTELDRLRAENQAAGDLISLVARELGANSNRESLLYFINVLKVKAAVGVAADDRQVGKLPSLVARLMVILDCQYVDHVLGRAEAMMNELRRRRSSDAMGDLRRPRSY